MVTPDLSVEVGNVRLKNPVLTASGTFGYGLEFQPFLRLDELGGLVTKGLSPRPRRGNPPERIVETPAGMLNAIGLQNVGVEAFLAEKLPRLRELGATVIPNVWGDLEEDYVAVVQALEEAPGIAAIELNISCPNVKAGGMAFGLCASDAASVVRAVRAACGKKPLLVKLSPNAGDLCGVARACEEEGADALSLVNTFKAIAIDVHRRRPVFDNVSAGLSGPAIKPIALRMVWEVCDAVNVPVIGMGGIATATDALEFLMAGAAAVQVGAATFARPTAMTEIIDGIAAFLAAKGIQKAADIIGAAKR